MGPFWTMNDLVPEGLRPRCAQFVRQTYGAMAHQLGWSPRHGEDDDTRLLRPGLLWLVADVGEDPSLAAEAGRLARHWLDDRRSLDPDLVGAALGIAARHGDRDLFDRFHAAARQTQDPRERSRLLGAMGAFRDPAILRMVHQIALTDEFHPNETLNLAFAGAGDPRTRRLAYEFVKQNFDALVARMPRNNTAFLIDVAGGFSDPEHAADAAAFFKQRAAKLPGGPRILAQTLEAIRLNIALKRAQLPSLEAFLQSNSSSAP
jgi:alanyl aminopeptidase